MKVKVTKNTVSITDNYILNFGEYNASKCEFTFDDEYSDLVKKARFVSGDITKEMVVDLNSECEIPYEITNNENENDEVTLNVYGYSVDGEELVLRYSPTPVKFYIRKGSYSSSTQEVITPSQFEQYEQQLNDGLKEVENVDIDVSKADGVATITITDRTGTEKSVEIKDGENGKDGKDGEKGEKGDKGDKGDPGEGVSDYELLNNLPKINDVELLRNKTLEELGVQPKGDYALKSEIPDTSSFITKAVSDLENYYKKSETYTQEEINERLSTIPKFNILVVNELPVEDISDTTIYLLRDSLEETGNLYEEYIYVNDMWELLGSQRVDLSNYYTKEEAETKIEEAQAIKVLNNQDIYFYKLKTGVYLIPSQTYRNWYIGVDALTARGTSGFIIIENELPEDKTDTRTYHYRFTIYGSQKKEENNNTFTIITGGGAIFWQNEEIKTSNAFIRNVFSIESVPIMTYATSNDIQALFESESD